MELDIFLNKRVKLVQDDDFIKTGILVGFDTDFVFLKFNDGRIISINKDTIKSVETEVKP